jgi:predicted MFS family arabinose efflux permease
MTQPLQERTLRSARAAVFALFASFGIVLSTWAVHLPVLKQSVEMSNAMTGTVLLILGIGSLAGMQLSGVAIDRWGTERVAVTAGAALGVSIVVPLTATTIGQAGIGALVLGISAGCADVGMNAAAVDVERDYGRPIMAAFHAVFSIGTVIGSLLGSAGFALQLTTLTTTSVTASLCLLTVGAACAGFRGYRASRDLTSDDVAVSPTQFDRRYRRVLLLGMLAFLLFLSEGSAMDWSSLHARQHLGASASSAALAVGSFVVAMTVARFAADRVAQAVGPVWVLRGGAILAAAGILAVIMAANLPVALAGWALFGLGLAGGLPQVLTAAGNLGGGSTRTLSRVVGVGYVAILGGPALIGWLVELVSWRGAFLVPLGSVIICAFAARLVARRDESSDPPVR